MICGCSFQYGRYWAVLLSGKLPIYRNGLLYRITLLIFPHLQTNILFKKTNYGVMSLD